MRGSRPYVLGSQRPVPVVLAALAVLPALSAMAPPVAAQQRPLEHDDVLHWNTIASPSLSPDGTWLAFVLTAMEGDPSLTIRAAQEGGPEAVVRGANPVFSSDSRHLVYDVPPTQALVDSLKREGKKGDDLPKDSLAVVELAALFQGGEFRPEAIRVVGPVNGRKVASEGSWAAYEPVEDEDKPEEAEDAEEQPSGEAAAGEGSGEAQEEGDEQDQDKEDGSPLVLHDLATGDETRYEHVTDYEFAEDAPLLAFATSTKDGSGDGVHVVALDGLAQRTVMEGEGRYEQLAVSADGQSVAFLSDRDSRETQRPDEADEPDAASQQETASQPETAEPPGTSESPEEPPQSDEASQSADTPDPEFALYQGTAPEWAGMSMADSDSPGVPEGWGIGRDGEVAFSEGGGRILFGVAPRPAPEEEDDDVLEEDKVVLDVWNWRDPYLQPMQLVRADDERKRTYAAAVLADGGPVVQLGSPDVPTVRHAAEGDATHALGVTDAPYRQLLSWDGRYNDLYALDMATGERRLLAEKVKGFGGGSISPAGKYAAWWDGARRQWMVARLDGRSTRGAAGPGEAMAASAQVPHPVWNELDDHPDLPPPYGSAGWTEDDRAFLFYDRYDVWRFDPETGAVADLTEGAGRAAGVRFRYARADPELAHVPEGSALWRALHYTNKQAGFYRGRTDRPQSPEPLVMSDHAYRLRGKAENADRWLVTREDFREFPDLWIADGIMDVRSASARDGGRGAAALPGMTKMSDANPQQAEFRWGSAEIVEWSSNDGVPLQGILFKPDDFDPSQKHPMMVYFYERMSDGIHNYRSPRPGGSSISVPFYVSRGYVVFVPDIPYEIGYPGESALDAVVPGVLRVLAEGFVDKDKIGVQGHSWGGYQIAYMITKTNLFAAAEAGAPVSNMTSAYGGIRWQSGMSRMFQYERTQSRIGGSLWEATNEYLHNSPVFYADKIWTPLLMMHNDEDGAVPWYQGIEMFVAMRRLQRPVWMLNYNGEAHGLRKEANRKDWAVRMQQFFDHYLKDAPAPVWMEEGIPAVDKGKTLGTEPARRKLSS